MTNLLFVHFNHDANMYAAEMQQELYALHARRYMRDEPQRFFMPFDNEQLVLGGVIFVVCG